MLTNKRVSCVMWDESNRGANEMASGMLKWAVANMKKLRSGLRIGISLW